MTPRRIQMSRQHPWRADNPDAVIVDRKTKWGNPWRVVPVRRAGPFDVWRGEMFCGQLTGIENARHLAVERFRHAIRHGWGDVPWPDEIRAELAGKDLACWCPLDAECHGDVLLAIARGEQP